MARAGHRAGGNGPAASGASCRRFVGAWSNTDSAKSESAEVCSSKLQPNSVLASAEKSKRQDQNCGSLLEHTPVALGADKPLKKKQQQTRTRQSLLKKTAELLAPPPRLNLTRFHGVFAPNGPNRARIRPAGRRRGSSPDKPVSLWSASSLHQVGS
mgnify:CR=1 FL=1